MKKSSGKLKFLSVDNMVIKSKTEILVIDPCYLFSGKPLNDVWQEFVDLMYSTGHENVAILKYNGATMLYTNTAHGDGCYYVTSHLNQIGTDCGVDAGMLCFISKKDALKINPKFKDWKSGVILKDFKGELRVDGKGNLFGDNGVKCITDGNYDQENDY